MKGVGRRIIAFVAQIEEFQKRLFTKKKFVTEVHYCVTLDRVPESMYREIVKNKAQVEEWKRLFQIQEIARDTTQPGYSEPLKASFLESHQNLVIDTQFFGPDFKDTLLASPEFLGGASSLDEALDGLLVHAENFQALRLLGASYHRQAKCIYIDPPYNTAKDIFPYKDGYKHGTWLAMLSDRLAAGLELLREDGVMFISIDQNEFDHLSLLGKHVFGAENEIGTLVWKNARDNNPTRVATEHEYVLCYSRDQGAVGAEWKNNFADAKELLLAEHDRLKAFRLKPPQIEEQIRVHQGQCRSLGRGGAIQVR